MRSILVIAVLLLTSAVQAQVAGDAASSKRPVTPTTEYHGITLDKLLSVFRRAYVDAGFRFKKKRISKGGAVRLFFEFPIAEYSYGRAFAVLTFSSSMSARGLCAPCSVHRESLGVPVDYAHYDGSAVNKAQSVVYAADARANAVVKAQLGKDLSDVTHAIAREP